MLNNHEIIRKMTLEEKVSFILSKELYKTPLIEDFKFPVFSACNNPIKELGGKIQTKFPRFDYLANSWNVDLIKKVGNINAVETKAYTRDMMYEIPARLNNSLFSKDPYQNGKMIESYILGLKEYMMPTILTDLNLGGKDRISKEVDLSNVEIISSNAKPSAMVFETVDEIQYFRRNVAYKKDVFGKSEGKEETVRLINAGCELIFVGDKYDSIKEFVIEAVINFNIRWKEAKSNIITMKQFEDLLYNGSILSEENLNLSVDKLIDFLIRMEKGLNVNIREMKNSISNDQRKSYFDESLHAVVAKNTSDESIVLLKNEDNLLPLQYTERVALIGEYANNPKYQLDLYDTTPTRYETAYDIIRNYDINCVGFAHGYVMESDENEDLIKKAVELASKASYSLVYLYAKDCTELPKDQLDLLIALRESGTPVIAVLITNSDIDLSFDKYVNSLLFVGLNSQEVNKSILDIVIGDVNPSGHISRTILNNPSLMIENKKIPRYINNKNDIKYPYGHGLSYSNFEYTYLEANENGVTFTITNKSDIPGYEVSYLFVKSDEEDYVLADKMLKGFVKTFVDANESVKVTIPFDEMTFRYYNEKYESFGILGGNYDVLVGRSIEDIRLTGVVKLKSYLNSPDISNEVLEESTDFDKLIKDFAETNDKLEYYKAKRGVPKKVRLAISIIMWLYFDFILGALMYSGYENDNYDIVMIFGAIAIVFNIVLIIVVRQISKIKEIPITSDYTDSLTRIVEKVDNFEILARVTYEKPVEVLEEEEEITEIPEEVKEDDLEIEPKFDSRFNNVIKESSFDSALLLNDSYMGFINYVKRRNININPELARSLFSAIFSFNIVFITSRNKDLVKPILDALNEYFDCKSNVLDANDEWKEPFDLIWQKENDSYIKTSFIEAVNFACVNKNNICFAMLDNVKMSNFKSYFIDFIRYATNPKKERYIKITDEEAIKLPKNISYIISLQENEQLNIPYDIARYSAVVDLVTSNTDEEVIDTNEENERVLSYAYMQELIVEAKKNYFVSEELWKKLDYFEEQINQMEYYEIGNKNVLQIEIYTSIFMSYGADEVEAFDNAIAAKVMPIVKSLDIYKTDEGYENILKLFDRVFNDDLRESKRVLKERM